MSFPVSLNKENLKFYGSAIGVGVIAGSYWAVNVHNANLKDLGELTKKFNNPEMTKLIKAVWNDNKVAEQVTAFETNEGGKVKSTWYKHESRAIERKLFDKTYPKNDPIYDSGCFNLGSYHCNAKGDCLQNDTYCKKVYKNMDEWSRRLAKQHGGRIHDPFAGLYENENSDSYYIGCTGHHHTFKKDETKNIDYAAVPANGISGLNKWYIVKYSKGLYGYMPNPDNPKQDVKYNQAVICEEPRNWGTNQGSKGGATHRSACDHFKNRNVHRGYYVEMPKNKKPANLPKEYAYDHRFLKYNTACNKKVENAQQKQEKQEFDDYIKNIFKYTEETNNVETPDGKPATAKDISASYQLMPSIDTYIDIPINKTTTQDNLDDGPKTEEYPYYNPIPVEDIPITITNDGSPTNTTDFVSPGGNFPIGFEFITPDTRKKWSAY